MTITIDFLPEVEAKIRKQALDRNMKVEDYLILLIKEDLEIREEFGQENSTKIRND